ncbi:HD-GYP domain-containing protein [Halioxenophilus aromaticivorans]|uniref:HD-GYP domain-containing protein n=1 Tax=Halioxenophilus aromaticivorans TaxID=1306992 RepID=A0AAV3U4D4_9ALTE
MATTSKINGHFVSERNSKKIHVSELQIGMWISKLDRDWLDTPFLMQGFLVETPDDIATVAEFSQFVWVEAEEEQWVDYNNKETLKKKFRAKTYINQVNAQTENRKVLGVYREARRITKSLLDEARFSSVINAETAKQTVDDCVHSVIRNSDALMWLSKIRSKDEYTSEHCLNVCILSIAFGRQLGYEEQALKDLGMCGLLHDVGKMKIPLEILNKPGKFTPNEAKIMKSHSILGRNMLMAAGTKVAQAVDVAWSHHEQINGKGYPRRLEDRNISRYTRIVSIVDAFDAMTADRCYSKAKTSTQALKIIYRNRGTQFDSDLAEQFLRSVGLYPPGTLVELNNGMAGLVIETNQKYRHLPKVIILRNQLKQRVKEKILNLALIEQGRLSNDFLIKDVHVDGTFGVSVREYQERGLLFRHK